MNLVEKKKSIITPSLVFALLSVVFFLSTYYIMVPVLPLHMQDMGGDNFTIGLIMGIFSAVSLIFRPLSGKLSDRRDPVFLLKISVFAFFLAPLLYIYPSFILIALAQGVFGFTIGMFSTASGVVITGLVSDEHVSQVIGIHSVAIILAKGMAPTFGSVFYESVGMFGAVIATAVLGGLTLICIFRLAPMKPGEKARGNASMLKVFTRKVVWVPAMVSLMVSLTFGAIMSMLPLLAKERGIENFNWFFTVNTAVMVILRVTIGRLKIRENILVISSSIAAATAMVLLSFAYNLPFLLLAAAIYGYGYGVSHPTLTGFVVVRADHAERGSAYGIFTAFFDIGVSLGSLWAGFSEYLGYLAVYQLAALAPLLGIGLFALSFLRKNADTKASK